jgi:L-gulonate 5-dehydrogenase
VKGVVTRGPFDVVVVDLPAPEPAPSEALVRIERVGVCGSDVSFFKGSHPYRVYPRVQGHEAAGRIVAFGGDETNGLAVGDLVAIEPLLACGACYPCRIGRSNCCTSLRVLGAHVDGTFREAAVLPVGLLHPAGDLDADLAALCEPVSIAVQAVARGDIGPADRVVVFGAGPIGASICLAAADRGARVLCVDLLPSRLALARAFGAERTVEAGAEAVEAVVSEWTDGEGPSVTVDAVGTPAVIRQACTVVANAGRVVIVGLSEQEVSLPVIDFTRKEMTILGSRNNAGRFRDAVALVGRHRGRIGAMITHRYPLDRVPEALAFATKQPGAVEKVMIEFGPD